MWVRRMDVQSAQYSAVKGVDVQQSVDDFKGRWVAEENLDVRPSRITLRLVRCGLGKPRAEEEAAAVVLDDPSLSLGEAGVAGTAWLLAFIAKPSSVASAPARVIAVTSRVRGRQQLSEWHVSSQEDLDRHLAHGLLWLLDSAGQLVRSVVLLSELSQEPSPVYYFQRIAEMGDVDSAAAAIRNWPLARESTRGIANDPLVQQAFGAVELLSGGEPLDFSEDDRLLLEVDGLLGTQSHEWVLLNSVKLTAGSDDVYEAVSSALKLADLLRSAACGGQSALLAPYAHARVHAFLSASHFLPGVAELAVQKGVTPVLCSGARFHVPPAAAASLPGAPGNPLT